MDQESEFTKPLKGYAPDKREDRRRWVAGVLLAVAAIGLPTFHFYNGWAKLGELFKSEPQQIVVVQQENSPPEPAPDDKGRPALQAEQTAQTDINTIRPAPQDYQLDPDGGNIQRVAPGGNLAEVKPVQKPVAVSRPIRRQEEGLAHLPDPELIERGATGVIPKRSPDGLRAMDVYSRRPDTQGNFGVARVVIVIGGLGISQSTTQQAISELPGSVTLAFAPYGNSLTRWMQEARKGGHELLLQVPMEPLDYPQNNPGPHTLKAEANLQENIANLHWSMSRITNYVGVTNYLGNKMLQQPAGLAPIFAEIAERGLLFFEDGTVQNSLGEGVAVKELLPYARASILLDNTRSRSAIAGKLNKLASEAKRTGLAIGMGNAFPDTVAMVAEFARRARENGIEITPVTAIVKDPAR